jgi:hypothetical protein
VGLDTMQIAGGWWWDQRVALVDGVQLRSGGGARWVFVVAQVLTSVNGF